MKYLLIAIVLFFLNVNFCYAQKAYSSDEIVEFYPGKLKKIAAKIQHGFVTGQLIAYHTDSLKSAFLPSEVAQNGAKTKLDDEGNDVGTTPLNLDSANLSLAFSYKIQTGENGAVTFLPMSVAPNFETFLCKMSISVPFGWAAMTELKSFLSKDEMYFLNKHAQWYLNFPSKAKSSDFESAAYVDIENWLNTGSASFVDALQGNNYIGKAVVQNLTNNLFYAVRAQKLHLLNHKMEKVIFNDFILAHSIKTMFQIQDNGWNNWADSTSDPYTVKDTLVDVFPYEFDSIAIEQVEKKMYWTVFQKINSGELVKYYIDFNQAKKNLPAPLNDMLLCFIEDKFKKK